MDWDAMAKRPAVLITMLGLAALSIGGYMGDQVEVVVPPPPSTVEPVQEDFNWTDSSGGVDDIPFNITGLLPCRFS